MGGWPEEDDPGLKVLDGPCPVGLVMGFALAPGDEAEGD